MNPRLWISKHPWISYWAVFFGVFSSELFLYALYLLYQYL